MICITFLTSDGYNGNVFLLALLANKNIFNNR